jgi:dihydrodipicolinate synthase/N-acetylneuraminate lyase
MDVSTKEEWLNIGAETAKNQPRVAEGILNMLRGMDTIIDGFVTDQLTHALQTATMAERAGADDEVVVAPCATTLARQSVFLIIQPLLQQS